MNMILHNYATAEIKQGNTLANPLFIEGDALKTFDYVVANPPFSDKRWSTGLLPASDPYQRFQHYGVPPAKQGDYAYLLHILRSMRSTGKGACILPHGVLFRSNAEAVIRKNLVQRGIIKGIIGLPANLFYGTGIPACIIVLDKEHAQSRKGVFMMDASKGFRKDGPKNRLREQDIHRIVDTFTRQLDIPGYARMVPLSEIADPRNDFNLNLPRYIASNEADDVQDIDGHLRGGIPDRDIEALARYWHIMPGLRQTLFQSAGRAGYHQLKHATSELKPTILGHAEFAAFNAEVSRRFGAWQEAHAPHLRAHAKGCLPKALIEALSESLLEAFRPTPLLDAYDLYQHLMDYWAETMQDDCYIISADGWVQGAQPREIVQARNKDGKMTWLEVGDYTQGKRRFKSDLVPAEILIARYFAAERAAIEALQTDVVTLAQQLDERREEQGGEDGLLAEVIEGEGDKQKITDKAIKTRLKEMGDDPEFADERAALTDYAALMSQHSQAKTRLKEAETALENKLHAQYPKLNEADVKTLVVEDKWLAALAAAVQSELDRVGQTLTGRIRQLAERYATPLPQLVDEVAALAVRVDGHLQKMGMIYSYSH
jgi:type I restriction enzyme M protein